MQQNKYLDDLGLKITDYGTNFMPSDDARAEKWQQEVKEYGFSSVETWNMDRIFAEWLYSHMMMYKERNNCAMDRMFVEVLEEHDDYFEYTEKPAVEVMDEIIEASKDYILLGIGIENKEVDSRFKTATRWFADTITNWWW